MGEFLKIAAAKPPGVYIDIISRYYLHDGKGREVSAQRLRLTYEIAGRYSIARALNIDRK
jgi:hypothetical protein